MPKHSRPTVLRVQRIDLTHFKVGAHYVTWPASGAENACTCEDYHYRQKEAKGLDCKHLTAAKLGGPELKSWTVTLTNPRPGTTLDP